eukprot:GHVN01054014.1.p1 GENE.GHVN01054014.1~~GHVN01054014.1.p1  ORF type:complete len:108 (+),score=18.20 GHVN01054014.1:98-421(+)
MPRNLRSPNGLSFALVPEEAPFSQFDRLNSPHPCVDIDVVRGQEKQICDEFKNANRVEDHKRCLKRCAVLSSDKQWEQMRKVLEDTTKTPTCPPVGYPQPASLASKY